MTSHSVNRWVKEYSVVIARIGPLLERRLSFSEVLLMYWGKLVVGGGFWLEFNAVNSLKPLVAVQVIPWVGLSRVHGLRGG